MSNNFFFRRVRQDIKKQTFEPISKRIKWSYFIRGFLHIKPIKLLKNKEKSALLSPMTVESSKQERR